MGDNSKLKIPILSDHSRNFWEDMSILITGGAGFIGSHLAKSILELGAEVSIFDDFSTGKIENLGEAKEFMKITKGDVRDFEALNKIVKGKDVIFHLAASASVPISVSKPSHDFNVNVGGTFNVLKAILENDSDAKLIYVSTAAVYGETDGLPIAEDVALKPISPYGASKFAGENYCSAFYRTYGIPSISLRYFNVYGPNQPRYVAYDFLEKLRKNSSKLEILGNGEQTRDFIYVSDAVNATIMLAQNKSLLGEAFNIGTSKGTKIKDIAELMVSLLGLKERTKFVFTGESWVGDIQRFVADTSKIKKLGFKVFVPLEEGLRKLIEWYTTHDDLTRKLGATK